MVKKSRELRAANGILADPMKKRGKSLPDERVMAFRMFYEDDEFSRMCPGKKDFVSVSKRTEWTCAPTEAITTHQFEGDAHYYYYYYYYYYYIIVHEVQIKNKHRHMHPNTYKNRSINTQ